MSRPGVLPRSLGVSAQQSGRCTTLGSVAKLLLGRAFGIPVIFGRSLVSKALLVLSWVRHVSLLLPFLFSLFSIIEIAIVLCFVDDLVLV